MLLLERLKRPTEGIEDSIFVDLSSVDINEVAGRAIKRKKPANANGEELRDVMIWLIVVDYARQGRRGIAFVSSDSDFRVSKDAETLHPDLEAELSPEKIEISFHTSIAGFITKHSLDKKAITEPYLSRILAIKDIQDEATKVLLRRGTAYGAVEEGKISSLAWVEGTEYKVSSTSLYLELVCRGEVLFRIRPSYFQTTNYPTTFAITGADSGVDFTFGEEFQIVPAVSIPPVNLITSSSNLFVPNVTAATVCIAD